MKTKFVSKVLFAIYLAYLVWIILFKMDVVGTLLHASQTAYGSLNTTLFAATAVVNGHLDYQELGLNLLIFIPLGVYLKLIWERMNDFLAVGIIIATSFAFEALQYLFSLGAADITDIATNSLGGILGLIVIYYLKGWWKKETVHRVNWLSLLATGLFMIWFFGYR